MCEDDYLIAASQLYEAEKGKKELDELLLAASQHYEASSTIHHHTPSSTRFGAPRDVEEIKRERVPKKTQANTVWALNIKFWHQWASQRLHNMTMEEYRCGYKLDVDLIKMDNAAICFWLQRFILEVRKVNGEHYCPDSLYQISCGLQCGLRNADDVNVFEEFEFAKFCLVLDGELKQLNSTGNYIHKKKANVITVEMEGILWEKGLLGDQSITPSLSDTMFYLIGLFFALRSDEEHRQLRYKPSQLKLVEIPGETSYLAYKEDISKTNQGRLMQRKLVPKQVIQHANKAKSSTVLGMPVQIVQLSLPG